MLSGEDERAIDRAARSDVDVLRSYRERGLRLYVASFSFRTITYKALCAADRLADFYPDLADERN